MARPQKDGIDYFPLNVFVDQDDKYKLIEAKHGLVGFAVLIKLLMKIYSEGYFYPWGEKESLLHSQRVNVDINIVNDIVKDSVRWEIFNPQLFEKYKILTSNGIQKRYWEAAKRRNNITIVKQYWVHDVNNILVNANINLVNVDGGTQIKEKNIKEKDINKSGASPQKNIPPTLEEVQSYCKERNKGVDAQKWYDFYLSKGWMIGKNKMKDWKAAVRTWENPDKPQVNKPTFSNFENRSYDTQELKKRLLAKGRGDVK